MGFNACKAVKESELILMRKTFIKCNSVTPSSHPNVTNLFHYL